MEVNKVVQTRREEGSEGAAHLGVKSENRVEIRLDGREFDPMVLGDGS